MQSEDGYTIKTRHSHSQLQPPGNENIPKPNQFELIVDTKGKTTNIRIYSLMGKLLLIRKYKQERIDVVALALPLI